MEMEPELSQVARARLFWSSQDLDSVFCEIQSQLNLLQTKLKNNTASDKDLVQSLKLLEALDWPSATPPPVVKVVIGSAVSPAADSTTPPALAPGPVSEDLPLAPVAPVQYEPHCCSKSCVPTVPSMPQSLLLAQNPLNTPIIYGFHRLNCGTNQSELSGEQLDQSEQAVVYLAPCGLRLCNYDDVMDFLLKTEIYHFLQLDLFCFSPLVCVSSGANCGTPETASSGPSPGPSPSLDLSRGLELTPVELCVSDGQRPPEFKYRRERWPRGCFLSTTPTLFRAYCDCRGRCAAGCACVALTTGHGYQHERLLATNKTGIFECGPWCGCDPGLCQNRVVQRGLRVRLQVYRTTQDQNQDQNQEENQQKPDPDRGLDQGPDRGWGVRCKDDLEKGTFICVYAGVVLQRSDGQPEAPPPKQRRAELPSDDDIELVTEWLPCTTPNQTHVIQRGTESAEKVQTVRMEGRHSPDLPGSERVSVNGTKQAHPRVRTSDQFYLLDASKEGNVSRFFNHSCEPTLFIQNVFTDSHDVKFPNIAFFTKRALKAGTELTWDYNSAPSQEVNGSRQEVHEGNQEVPCMCCSAMCRARFYITELKQPGA